MILHVASMAAFFVDQVTQAPVVVQCAQAAPEPWWKLLIQPLSSILSVAGGVVIAVWSFHANSGKEHRLRSLDQRADEWRSVLDSLLSLYKGLPAAFSESFQKIQGENSSAADADLLNAWLVKSRIETLLFITQPAKEIDLPGKFLDLIETAKKMKIELDTEGKFRSFVQADRELYKKQFESLAALVCKKAIEDTANQEKARISFWNPYKGI